MDFETYYPQSPQKPKWVHAMCEESAKLRVKRQQISEIQIHEMFKKLFGYKKAIKYKVTKQILLGPIDILFAIIYCCKCLNGENKY